MSSGTRGTSWRSLWTSVVVMDGDSRVTVRTLEEAGPGHDHIRYRLGPSETELSAGRRLEPDVQLHIDQNWANTIRKRALPNDCAQSLRDSLSSAQLERVASNRAEALRRRASMLIRPALPVGWVHPSVPGEPSHSSPWGFELPDVNFLRFLNAHPRDRHIKFYADTHVYFVNGVKTLGSVTGLVHYLAQPFDADDVILRMSRGRNWPRPGYLRTVWQPEDVLELQQMPSACDLVSLLVSSRRDEQAICDAAKALRSRCPQAASFVDRLSLTTAEIKYKWDTNRDEAARAGTWMHFTFEVARLASTNQSPFHPPMCS